MGVGIRFSFGASSLAARQVAEGAPADILITADSVSMDVARRAQVVGRPTVLARNRLVLAVEEGNPLGIDGLDALEDPELRLVLCEREVPCGRLARELLFDEGVIPAVDSYQPNVGAAVGKVVIGEADATLAYRTDVVAREPEVDGIELEAAADPSVQAEYLAAVVNASPDRARARRFLALLTSPDGVARLRSAGFLEPGSSA